MAVIGYARVSTQEQNLDLQLSALNNAGCTIIFSEKVSTSKDREELAKAMNYMRDGDLFVVWKLDRLGRSLKNLVEIIEEMRNKNVEFRSLQDGIDTSSSLGRCQFGIFAALAEYERDIIRERTRAGLRAAREKGVKVGRKIGLSKEARKKAKTAKMLYLSKENFPVNTICDMLKIRSRATLYRYLRYENITSFNKTKFYNPRTNPKKTKK